MIKATRTQWIKCTIALVLYLAFLVWVRSWLGLIVVPFIFDIYITKKNPLVVLEEVEESGRAQRNELGRCHCICFSRRLLCQHLHLPELSDPFLFIGEVIVGRRLPVCEQDELRATRAEHTALHAVGTAHVARHQYQVVHRVAAMEIQTRAGIRQGQDERHRGVQLPCRRHRGHKLPAD